MKGRRLLIAPNAAVILYGITHALAGRNAAAYYFCEAVLVKLLALGGCLAAALRYRPGDRNRTIWMLFVVDFALLVSKELLAGTLLPLPALGPTAVLYLRTALVLGANLSGTLAWIILARTWRVAGLTLEGSPTVRRAALAGAILAAFALVGWGARADLVALIGGQREAMVNLISDVADVIGFSLLAPVALTAWTFRGGTLAWPYLYLALCTMGWMLYDVTGSAADVFNLSAADRRSLTELLRVVACSLHFAAGLAQRWALRGPPPSSG
jgi:hypothetical protein